MDLKKLGQRLREARERRNLSQEDLGALIGKDQTAISEYENAKRKITITDLPRLAEVLNVSINYFFEGELTADDLDRALLREFHQLPDRAKLNAIEVIRLLNEIANTSKWSLLIHYFTHCAVVL